MITNITLQNFKCFHSISIDPKLITVFIGPNGTGKSGVMQALLLLKQSRNNVERLLLDGELIQFPAEAFMWQGPVSSLDGVRLSLFGSSHIDSEEIQEPIKFEIDLRYSQGAGLEADLSSTKWVSSGQVYEISFNRDPHRSFSRPQYATPKGSIDIQLSSTVNGFGVTGASGRENPNSPLWRQLSRAPAETLTNIRMVPASRGLTRGTYMLRPESVDDISGVNGLGEQEDATATTLAYNRRMVEKVSHLMEKITGVGFRVDTVPPQSARLVVESLLGDISLLAEGFGTNALVQLLFVMVRTVRGATVLIEEPEIHLHPKAQADLASVLVDEAKLSDKQIVMTTHSEHVAGRLLTLVAEGTLSADELAIYSFEKDKKGVCSASKIEVTDRGQVNRGLKGFFETDMAEMRRYVAALRAKA